MKETSSTPRRYEEHKRVNLAEMAVGILRFWEEQSIFEKSIAERQADPPFNFYEGPPSANGRPGIHHVMARTIKDIFCRFKTLEGYRVHRKGGWDTHGLPIELEVERELGIVKEDIGKKISIVAYNDLCRKTVMRYKAQWDELTVKMGYWVDLGNPYVTYERDYIETLWWALKELYKKGLLYKGYSIQPYSPAAGTGLSSHELNMPGCYREVKDVSIIAAFEVTRNAASEFLFAQYQSAGPLCVLAWTTTPWTLPANSALAVGAGIRYLLVDTINPYTHQPMAVIVAREAFSRYFHTAADQAIEAGAEGKAGEGKGSGRAEQWRIMRELDGATLVGVRYKPLMPYVSPRENADKAFSVIAGGFVTTEDGTGIVHISPTFGADDFRVALAHQIPPITVQRGKEDAPLVDRSGRFIPEVGEQLAARIAQYGISVHRPIAADSFYVKNYTGEDESAPGYKSVDTIISIILKEEGKAFKVEKYTHAYPHCWRTNKPILYYPIDAWFIRTTALKDRMVELNKTINWKPASTGEGRFGYWLENLVDWNLSRSRYWGTPLPIWRTEDGAEEKCIGSLKELSMEIERAQRYGIAAAHIDMETFDPHRPHVDEIVLANADGKPMYREPDLVDVWFDSGAMPYAQLHYPFENQIGFGQNFPADYIAEGVDQTRGWFFTLHALAVMLSDSVAFRNVIANGLVLDKDGNKMSKSKGNTIDPFYIINKYGPDATRWYMVENAPPWENLRFDEEGVAEVERRFFSTLLNTYSFFALYANIDGFTQQGGAPPRFDKLPDIDRWIISCLQSLIEETTAAYRAYEPTRAARAIQRFVSDQLSNWYIRLNRKRFWQPVHQGAGLTANKAAAYETLHECMMTVGALMSPIAPFFSEWLYQRLIEPMGKVRSKKYPQSVHLIRLAEANSSHIDKMLEQAMDYAQQICSLAHSIRKKSKIKVKTPLRMMLLPTSDHTFIEAIRRVEDIIKAEVNVKAIEYIGDDRDIVVKRVKPNYKKLGKQYGPRIREIERLIGALTREELSALEQGGLSKEGFDLTIEDVVISSEDVPGWTVATENQLTVALDTTITEAFREEGMARDFVNRIQNLRKKMELEVTDKITIAIDAEEGAWSTLEKFRQYICNETQALILKRGAPTIDAEEIALDECVLRVNVARV